MHLPPPPRAALAAGVGVWGCGVWRVPAVPRAAYHPLHRDPAPPRQTQAVMADRGVALFDLKRVRIEPDLRVDELLPPGKGDIDLAGPCASLPGNVPMCTEVPNHRRAPAMGYEAWTRAALAATRTILVPASR